MYTLLPLPVRILIIVLLRRDMASEDLWSEEELKASVKAYADMYRADQEGRKFTSDVNMRYQ